MESSGSTASLLSNFMLHSDKDTFSFLHSRNIFLTIRSFFNYLIDFYLHKTELFNYNLLSSTFRAKNQLAGLALDWLIKSKHISARQWLQKLVAEYEELDNAKSRFDERLNEIYLSCKKRKLSDVKEYKLDKLIEWDHQAHVSILRNKKMLDRYYILTKDMKYFGQPINIVLTHHYYRKNLSHKLLYWFDKFNDIAGVFENIRTTTMASNFGELTALVKKYRTDVFGERWHDLCDLNTIYGYNMKSKIENMSKDLLDWLEPKEQTFPKDVDYYSEMTKHIAGAFKGSHNEKRCTLNDFISDAHLWVVSGSSNGIKDQLYDHLDHKVVKSGAKKMALFTTIKKDKLLADILDDVKQEPFIPSVKVELGMKDRMILACGNIDYLRMSYISYNIEPLLRRSHICPFYEDVKFKYYNYDKKVKEMRNGNICLPFDARAFDKYCRRAEINACFKAFELVIDRVLNKDNIYHDVKRVMKLIINSLNKHNWSLLLEGKLVEWLEGMPSGLRWTSLMGTLINYARALVISEYVNRKWGITCLKSVVAAGDDDDFVVNSWFGGFLLFKTYSLFKIPAHTAKNFISNKETEFLKNITTIEGDLFGYKARKVANLFFVSPEKQLKPEGTYDEINFSVYDGCVRRGLVVEDQLDQDSNWKKLLVLPRVLKGFGAIWMKKPPFLHNSRRLTVEGRFELKSIRGGTGLSINIIKSKDFLKSNNFSIDFKRWEGTIKKNIGAAMVPMGRTNITSIKEDKLTYVGDFEEIDKSDFYRFVLRYKNTKVFKPFRVKQDLAWLDYRSIISLIEKEDFLRFIETICDVESLTVFNMIRHSEKDNNKAVFKVKEWLSPSYPFKIPYTQPYSVEFVNAFFGDIMERATIDHLIHDDLWSFDDKSRYMLNRRIGIEKRLCDELQDMSVTDWTSDQTSVPEILKTFFNLDLRRVTC